MSYNKEDLKIINGVYCLFLDNLKCIENWGFYLFDKALDGEPELRNKIGIIWLASLFDSIHAEVQHIEKYKEQAEQSELIHIPRYCNQAIEFFESIKEIIQKYSKQEQVFIIQLRNQWVHSFLSGRHNEKITIKYVEDGELKKEQLSNYDFSALVQPLFEQVPFDDFLKGLIDRFTARDTRYWDILGEIQRSHEIMYKAMQNGSEFQFRTISA